MGRVAPAGIVSCGTPLTEEELEEASYMDKVNKNEPFLEKVGDTLEIDVVKHIENDEYELGYTDSSGELEWMKVYKEGSIVWDRNASRWYEKNTLITIRHNPEQEGSTLERLRNDVDQYDVPKGDLILRSYRYELIIGGKTLQAGTTKRSCGKNCVRNVQTEIISD